MVCGRFLHLPLLTVTATGTCQAPMRCTALAHGLTPSTKPCAKVWLRFELTR